MRMSTPSPALLSMVSVPSPVSVTNAVSTPSMSMSTPSPATPLNDPSSVMMAKSTPL
jgi:hypothetical protein